MERNAVRAGSFYPADPDTLRHEIERSFTSKLGPGTLPGQPGRNRTLKGAVVPHAGYVFSGAVASWVYSHLVKDGLPSTIVIAGPNHTGLGKPVAVYSVGRWRTPLGSMEIDEEMAEAVIAAGGGQSDTMGHLQEHSIEVQLPFLQYCVSDVKILPVSMGAQGLAEALSLGKAVAEAVKKTGRDTVFLASSDFTHAGFFYMQAPPDGVSIDQFARTQDRFAIDHILELQAEQLIETVAHKNISMCGYGCIAAMLVFAKEFGAARAELLKYATSYEVSPGDAAVGYAAITVS